MPRKQNQPKPNLERGRGPAIEDLCELSVLWEDVPADSDPASTLACSPLTFSLRRAVAECRAPVFAQLPGPVALWWIWRWPGLAMGEG
jgi:hypothetical protein